MVFNEIIDFMKENNFVSCDISLINGEDIHNVAIINSQEEFITIKNSIGIHFIFKNHIVRISPKNPSKPRVTSKPHGF